MNSREGWQKSFKQHRRVIHVAVILANNAFKTCFQLVVHDREGLGGCSTAAVDQSEKFLAISLKVSGCGTVVSVKYVQIYMRCVLVSFHPSSSDLEQAGRLLNDPFFTTNCSYQHFQVQ